MACFRKFAFLLCVQFWGLSATEFTVCSYNCGGLSDHYDYLHAACTEKLMQERYTAEPEYMALHEKIQKIALKALFAPDSVEDQAEWKCFEYLTAMPMEEVSVNRGWYEKMEGMISSYKVRPVVIYDEKVHRMLEEHLKNSSLDQTRKIMARRIFAHHLEYDILCLQETNYLDASLFPEKYGVLFTEAQNGIAWNKERFEYMESLGSLARAMAIRLRDKETGKTILIASGHLTGCNPYRSVENDSAKGDGELRAIVDLFKDQEADFMVIGMDSNVTSLHPRLHILKEADYRMDYENYLEPTCTSPYQVLNNRIDWIAMKSHCNEYAITNIPVLSIGLNTIQTNMSDHKPIAAKIRY